MLISNHGAVAYSAFSNYIVPYTGTLIKINIIGFVNYCKINNVSFYVCMTYIVACQQSANNNFWNFDSCDIEIEIELEIVYRSINM